MADNTPQNNIPYVPENTLDPAAGLNLALVTIDALLQTSVISMALTAPPGSPAEGDRYIVKAPGSGAWAGHNNQLAMYETEGAFWNFYDARLILNNADSGIYGFDGSAWTAAGGIPDAPSDGRQYGREDGAWAAFVVPAGSVSSVNGIEPDTAGNVEIAVGDGTVRSVNGIEPDSSGDVELPDSGGGVQTVNGHGPDSSGNVDVPAGVASVNGIEPDTAGNIALPTEVAIQFACSDQVTPITTGTAKFTFRLPYAFTLTGVRASVNGASSSGNPTFDLNLSGATILSTKLSIDSGEKTSVTATTPAVISNSTMTDDGEMTVDFDTAGTGATGVVITLIGTRAP